jgi:small subunit ribosomal protein S16
MLAIRLQRTGRSGHAQFRLIAQDSRFSPKRGRVVAYLGSYNPHTKEIKLDAEKVSQYISNGAQPSDSAARLLRKEGIKLPAWVSAAEPKQGSTRNPDKRRSTRPAEAEAANEKAVPTEEPAEGVPAAEVSADTPAEPAAESTEPEVAEQPAPVSEAAEATVEPAKTSDEQA